jgi:antitoxin component HigA of HigAB toxin-antitoxin module
MEIKSEDEYQESLSELEDLISRDPPPGTHDYDRLELLASALEIYEEEHYPIITVV